MRSAHYWMTGLAILVLGFGATIGCGPTPAAPAGSLITPTPTSSGPTTIYANGVTDVNCGYFTATDGTSSAPLTVAGSGYGGYGTNTKSFSCVFFNLSGANPYSEFGMSNNGPVSSLEGYKTCTFYAQAQTNTNSSPVTVGFNAATPGGGTPDNLIVNEVLTSSWAPYTITITDGARTDGYTGPGTLAVTENYFVEKLTVAPSGGFPVTVYFDDVVLH